MPISALEYESNCLSIAENRIYFILFGNVSKKKIRIESILVVSKGWPRGGPIQFELDGCIGMVPPLHLILWDWLNTNPTPTLSLAQTHGHPPQLC